MASTKDNAASDLFTAVDADVVEANVLDEARKRSLEEALPEFDARHLGLPAKRIRLVASDVPLEVLRALSDRATRVADGHKRAGEKSLLVLDRSRLKAQVFRALLRNKRGVGADEADGAAQEEAAAAGAAAAAAGEESDTAAVDAQLQREEMIRMGLMTPLDEQQAATQSRRSVMQYKMNGAEALVAPGRRPYGGHLPYSVHDDEDAEDWTKSWKPPVSPRSPSAKRARSAGTASVRESAAGAAAQEGSGSDMDESVGRSRGRKRSARAAADAEADEMDETADGVAFATSTEAFRGGSSSTAPGSEQHLPGKGKGRAKSSDAAKQSQASKAPARKGRRVPAASVNGETVVDGAAHSARDAAASGASNGPSSAAPLGAPGASPAASKIGEVDCPVCGLSIAVADASRPDAALNAHLDRCLGRQARRRRQHSPEPAENGGAASGARRSNGDGLSAAGAAADDGRSVVDSEEDEFEASRGAKRRNGGASRPARGRLRRSSSPAVSRSSRYEGGDEAYEDGEKGVLSEGEMQQQEASGQGGRPGQRMHGREKGQGGLIDDYRDEDFEGRLDALEGESSSDDDEGAGSDNDVGGGASNVNAVAAAAASSGGSGGGGGGGSSGGGGGHSGDGGSSGGGRSSGGGGGSGGGGNTTRNGRHVTEVGAGLFVSRRVASRLFQYQMTGLRWMWQLHQQGAGGIVGDEMGLGKTVQVAAFLGALQSCNRLRSAIVIAPATMLAHWVSELHTWAPQLRVVVLHRSSAAFNAAANASSSKQKSLIRRTLRLRPAVVVVTTYEGARSLREQLLPHAWDYAVLDEGQKIRNPDADITLLCKQLRTVHRLVMTGTPIQNNLLELWSLFDFVFPGRLGTLPAFDSEFATPMRVGGYANATAHQAQLAYRCAVVLRDLIDPYLLRRQKKDIKEVLKLPKKTEQVLFCRLTPFQRRLYAEYITSPEVERVLSRDMRSFRAIGVLRKLCNHPDLVCRPMDAFSLKNPFANGLNPRSDDDDEEEEGQSQKFFAPSGKNGGKIGKNVPAGLREGWEDHGAPERSGKLLVLQQILPAWRREGHRVLLFSQTRIMLDVIERFVRARGWTYGRLDGSTPVGTRQGLIDRFNTDESVFIMLLTTRTGGVGTNLTGADRVILFDPDWNPSTDIQARERAWRFGQQRPVTIYRLITAGTIEEKIYHRQIFKTALTNRVLKDPKQKRLFSSNELRELFTLGHDGATDGVTETGDLFKGEGDVRIASAPQSTNRNGNGTDARQRQRQRRRRRGGPEDGGSDSDRGAGGGSSSGVNGRRKAGGERAGSSNGRRSPNGRGSPSVAVAEAAAAASAVVDAHSALLREETVMPPSEEPTNEAAESGRDAAAEEGEVETSPGESEVLRALFNGGPLTGVFAHDLAEGGEAQRQQRRQIEEVAQAAANRALERLRRSRAAVTAEVNRSGNRFVPTWTGRSGVGSSGDAAAAEARPARFGTVLNSSVAGSGGGGGAAAAGVGGRGAPSSSVLLQRIQERRRRQAQESSLIPELAGSAGAASSSGNSASQHSREGFYAALLERLHRFFRDRLDGASTADVLERFNDVPDAEATVFRQLLRTVAVRHEGVWRLREEMREI